MRITLECLKAENVIKRVGPSFEDIGKYFYQLLGNKKIRIMVTRLGVSKREMDLFTGVLDRQYKVE